MGLDQDRAAEKEAEKRIYAVLAGTDCFAYVCGPYLGEVVLDGDFTLQTLEAIVAAWKGDKPCVTT